MNPIPVTTEIQLAGWSVVLLLLHIAAQGALAVRETGLAWNAGPRDEARPLASPHARRAERALSNFKETYPAFLALALAVSVTGRAGGLAAVGAGLWFVARIVYLPLYVFGVPWLRTVSYGASMLGLVLMLIALLR